MKANTSKPAGKGANKSATKSVATALMHLPAGAMAHLRRVVSAAVVEFAEGATSSEPLHDADSWNSFLQQSPDLAVSGLPKDFSANHDHYLHGAPKRDNAS
jgi:hypothetical protein